MSTELEINVPLAHVRATIGALRRRRGLSPERGVGARSAAFIGIFSLGLALLLSRLDGVPSGQVWLAAGIGVLAIAVAVVFFLLPRVLYSDVDPRKLAVVERVLDEFEAGIHPIEPIRLSLHFNADWYEYGVSEEREHDECRNHWLHLGYSRTNGAIVVVGVTAYSRRPARGRRDKRVREDRRFTFERLKIGMVLPDEDLFGAAPVPPIEVEAEPGLTLHEIDVQSKAVVFHFDTAETEFILEGGHWRETSRPAVILGDVAARQVRACMVSVAGIRTFSRPDLDIPAVLPPEARVSRPSLGERLGALRARLGKWWYRLRTTAEQRHENIVRAVAEEVCAALVDDRHPSDAGLTAADRDWLVRTAAANSFDRQGNPRIIERGGFCHLGPDRGMYSIMLAERLHELYADLPAQSAREIAELTWEPTSHPFPADLNIRCVPVSTGTGGWIGVQGQDVRELGPTMRQLAKVPDNLDVNRCAAVAHDPGRDIIAIWQRAWARSPSRTFFYDKPAESWREHTHTYRSEDEHAAVSFLFDHKRDAFVRIGLTYNAAWSATREYRETAAGAVQLALGEDGRVAVSDARSGQTLVVDVQDDRVFRVAPAGWSLVARLSRAEKFEPHRAVWSLSAGAVRYEASLRRLICSRGYGADQDYALDLGPAFEAAAELDSVDGNKLT